MKKPNNFNKNYVTHNAPKKAAVPKWQVWILIALMVFWTIGGALACITFVSDSCTTSNVAYAEENDVDYTINVDKPFSRSPENEDMYNYSSYDLPTDKDFSNVQSKVLFIDKYFFTGIKEQFIFYFDFSADYFCSSGSSSVTPSIKYVSIRNFTSSYPNSNRHLWLYICLADRSGNEKEYYIDDYILQNSNSDGLFFVIPKGDIFMTFDGYDFEFHITDCNSIYSCSSDNVTMFMKTFDYSDAYSDGFNAGFETGYTGGYKEGVDTSDYGLFYNAEFDIHVDIINATQTAEKHYIYCSDGSGSNLSLKWRYINNGLEIGTLQGLSSDSSFYKDSLCTFFVDFTFANNIPVDTLVYLYLPDKEFDVYYKLYDYNTDTENIYPGNYFKDDVDADVYDLNFSYVHNGDYNYFTKEFLHNYTCTGFVINFGGYVQDYFNAEKSNDVNFEILRFYTSEGGYTNGYQAGFSDGQEKALVELHDSYYKGGYDFGYNQGVADTEGQLNDEYLKGYDTGRSIGYSSGFNAGAASASEYTFLGLFSAIIDAPIQAVTGLLNFNVLGFNMANFFFSLITLAIIIAVIRLVL